MAIKREYFPTGYEGKIYATTQGNPLDDPHLEVKELDCKITIVQDAEGEKIALYALKDGSWELVNSWNMLFDKPSFAPTPHDWYGPDHTGDRPLKAKEHTRNNPVHVAIRLEAVLMGQSGAARASSTMI
jgi:hypothetical protein